MTDCNQNDISLPAEMQNIPDLQKEYFIALEAGGQDKLYYFNANHLGSGSLITDRNGQTYQTLAYAPYGEDLVNIRNGGYDELRQFGGHYLDEESGLLQAEARYYSPPLSIPISTDPHWYNYPHITSYNWCGNNPIMLADPTGMDWYEKTNESGEKSLHFWYKQKGELEGYTHLDATLPMSNFGSLLSGGYTSMSMSTGFAENEFVTQHQTPWLQCARASNLMAEDRGAARSYYSNELMVVNMGENGRAGEANIDNLKDGIIRMMGFMEKGIPPVAGVDYRNGTANPDGDGMTDHYINITGFSINMQQNNYPALNTSFGFNITNGRFTFANCFAKTGKEGVDYNKYLQYNSFNGLVQYNNYGWTLTNLRVK